MSGAECPALDTVKSAGIFAIGRGAAPDVSVVLPSYRAAALALRSVDRIRETLAREQLSREIIVVDDGGGDFASDAFEGDPDVRLLRLPRNVGKGAAVAAGMRQARGRVRIFTDVDLPYDPDLMPVMVAYIIERGFHLVIGDRTLRGSSYHLKLGLTRRALSGVFSAFVGTIVTGGFFDTQCGLKAIRGDVADVLFRLIRIDRFAFDVELVYLALKYGADIKRVPVQLERNDTSSVRVWRDSIRGAFDVLRIKYNQMSGRYHSPELAAIVAADFESARGDGSNGRRERALAP
ncbi:MAG: glycosyltransferase [Gemmatimonadaceae bacterium]|nr:glycosyltransferase [Gemmatimonadaceae bacterium]